MTIYGKGCISNYRNCSLSYVWYSVLYRMLTVHKPFPEIFYFAMSATQSELHTSLMIGDNWKNDVEGAKNVGMGNVYYNIKGEKSLPFKPGFDMRDWREIVSFL